MPDADCKLESEDAYHHGLAVPSPIDLGDVIGHFIRPILNHSGWTYLILKRSGCSKPSIES